MTANERDLLLTSTAWLDTLWDAKTCLIRNPDYGRGTFGDQKTRFLVRESVWYALGLLQRRGSGDAARALRALETVLGHQLWAPGAAHHGTFRRSPEEPLPGPNAAIWRDYDPNWRQFIGTALALLLLHFAKDVPTPLRARLENAVELCVKGEGETRVKPSYSNIALLKAWLECYAGYQFDQPELTARGAEGARTLYRRFCRYDAFDEYNSPTYYGVVLYALALWRRFPFATELARWAGELEAKLWHDVAQLYHAGLKNLSGPFDRSYGVDMTQYAANLGLWIWAALGREAAPFPALTGPFDHGFNHSFDHSADFSLAPCVTLLGAAVPEAAKAHLETFLGERQVRRALPGSPERQVTAYLTHDFMVGAQAAHTHVEVRDQFCPVVAYWRKGTSGVGWLRLRSAGDFDAYVERNLLHLEVAGPSRSPNLQLELDGDSSKAWHLRGSSLHIPGLSLELVGGNWRVDEDGSLNVVLAGAASKRGLLKVSTR